MITKLLSSPRLHWICGWLAACAMASPGLTAQAPAPRIRSEISNSEMSTEGIVATTFTTWDRCGSHAG